MGKQTVLGVKRCNNQVPLRKCQNVKTPRFDRDEKIKERPLSKFSGAKLFNNEEPTMYAKLLLSLRQTEAHTVDLGEDFDDGQESSDGYGGKEEECHGEYSRPIDVGDDHQGYDLEDDTDLEASDTDEIHDGRVNSQSVVEPLMNTRFQKHLDYKLSKEEVNTLLEKKWKYQWELEFSNWKWGGTGECFLKELDMYPCYGLKPLFYKHWLDIYKESGGQDFHSSRQRSFFSICSSYRDVLHDNKKPFYLKGREEDANIMDAYVMHSLNHVFKTRDLLKKNKAKLTKLQGNMNVETINDEAFLDHGFTRPKVLILLPIASIALLVVQRLIKLTPPKYKANIENLERFFQEFGSEVTDDEDEDVREGLKSRKTSKPPDFKALFGGNDNDRFMLGMKFNRRSIRLYGDFHSSDMIIASPLGLTTKIHEAERRKDKDVDYLSSIEVLIIDHADIILMQNWTYLIDVVEKLNRMPSQQHGTDIMRIRQWYLDGQAPFYRQTMVFSSHSNQYINALFNHHCLNYEGKVKSVCEYKGVLSEVLKISQIYERFDTKTIENADDSRFEYFTKTVFPKIKDSMQGGIMIFFSCSFDYLRIAKFLKSQEASFCRLGEETMPRNISHVRGLFFTGKKKIMLYTERFHFYYRYKIRSIQNLIIYSLPERKELFVEVLNMLEGPTCRILFSPFDLLKLQRIVGSSTAKLMIASDQKLLTFDSSNC
ncbi:unnamed protein product [Cuscuta epithymum]|uniref:U3 small nucleolar RNA-associated protein 25 n=1 Tax=Cuscuta epithymum TaxID=186058 RepID=A0AAV0D2P4_9ASTE|nr:unnamed protein product [Cuscuta epithymum]